MSLRCMGRAAGGWVRRGLPAGSKPLHQRIWRWVEFIAIPIVLLGLGSAGVGVGRAGALDLARLGAATQSGDAVATSAAAKAIDGSVGTYSATAIGTNAFWEFALDRFYRLTRIEVTTPNDATHRGAATGLVLRVFGLRDQSFHRAVLADPGLGGTWAVELPEGLMGRVVRLGLEAGQPNGAGRHQVALAEVRLYGDPSPGFGPIALRNAGQATQSSDADATRGAAKAIDGDPATYSQTRDEAGGFWQVSLPEARALRRIELVNRSDAFDARMAGLVVSVFDAEANLVASGGVLNPGRGGVWGLDLAAGTHGRTVWVGLPEGMTNGAGDRVVSLAEVNLLTAENLARGRDAYAVRFHDGLPAAATANDGSYVTEFKTTDKTVDGYWETDLGATRVVESVRVVSAAGFAARLAHATVRLYDEQHDPVFAQHLRGTAPTFDVDAGGPVLARYVRVGFENKERSDPAGGIEWYLGLKEVEVYGRPADAVEWLRLTASAERIRRGESVTLAWQTEGVHRVDLYPGVGSLGALTDRDGRGTLEVRPAASTEYWLVGSHRHGEQVRAVTVEVDGRVLPVQISEFVARNRLSLEDGRNEAPDWIELHNPNGHSVNLEGFGLSDDPGRPRPWTFPSVEIAPHGFLVVLASGRGEPWDAAGGLHADFELNGEGEAVMLTAPDGVTVVDAVRSVPPQMEDLAYGRTMEGVWAFLEPTPGRPNLAVAYEGWLQPLTFSVPRGWMTNSFALSLSHPNVGAEVVYSKDGREPTTPYTGPLTIASTVSVRAAVRRSGYKSPRVQTHTYVFLEQVVGAANMNRAITQDARYRDRVRRGLRDLPVLSVAVPQLPDDYVERGGSVEILWPEGGSPMQADCGFVRFGGAWTTFPKKNYRLIFRAEYGARKLRAPLFRGFDRGFLAAEAFDEIDLGGGSHDMVERGFYLASRFAEDAMLEMGSLNPHGRFVHLFINGTYWGQYHARERLTDSFLANYLGGDRADYVNVRGNDNVGDSFILGTADPPQRQPWERVRSLRQSYRSVRPYLDVPHLIDFMLMWGYGDAESEYRAAGPVGAGTGFKFWSGDADGYLRVSALGRDPTGNAGPGNLLGGLLTERDPDFMVLLADRIQRHLFGDGALTPARNLARLNARMLEITNSLVAECARWGFRTPDNWEGAAQTIRTGLFPDRTRNLLGALRGRGWYPALDAPTLNQLGGRVTNGFAIRLSAANGTIYYTRDGTDPRLPGGQVASGAQELQTGGRTLVARGSGWRYWDRGSSPGPGWAEPAFDDRAWPVGRAKLGYGNDGEITPLQFGPDSQNKYRSYYFRQAFTVAEPEHLTNVVVEWVRDDGAVVYLNGHELFRDNMPAGAITYETFATAGVGGADETRWFSRALSKEHWVGGTNVLAVEVHQASANSTDLGFDLGLSSASATSAPALVVEGDLKLRARTLSGGTWSALVEADFTVAEPRPYEGEDLLLSEIHYNPDGADDFEFIELYNRGSSVLDLSDARLEGGVDFLFPKGFLLPPGGFALVVEDTTAFATRYQATPSPWFHPDLRVAGQWSGRLDDAGERVVLLTSNRVESLAVSYHPDGLWPGRADGRGSSLELREPAAVPTGKLEQAAYLARGRHWRSSGLYHGSPGRWDPVPSRVVINEVFVAPERGQGWVELHNAGENEVDLFGWHLSDAYAQPFRYAFPEGSSISAGGFRVVSEAQLGWELSEQGGEVLLVEGAGASLRRFGDTVDYGDLERGTAVGRFVRSDGGADFTELEAPTAGGANARPRLGPVVISEILYHPAPGGAEFVELANREGTVLPLNDPQHPGHTWSLSGAVAYTFPPGEQLVPGRPVIVCSTTPEAFRAAYDVEPQTAVYGPWTGLLDNAGESIKLNRSGSPRTDGTVPRYRMDRVQYEPDVPWPRGANASGVSLERVSLLAYGNDPGSWRASEANPTPGGFPGNRPPVLEGVPAELRFPAEALFRWRMAATDPDRPGQQLTFAQTGLPPGLTLDSTSGWILGRAALPGVYAVRITVTDDGTPSLAAQAGFTLTITPGFALQMTSPAGEFPPHFRFQAQAGGRYEIEFTESLEPAEWSLLIGREGLVEGELEFLDEQPLTGPQRFYRVRWLNPP